MDFSPLYDTRWCYPGGLVIYSAGVTRISTGGACSRDYDIVIGFRGTWTLNKTKVGMFIFLNLLRTHRLATFIMFLVLFSFFAGYRLKSLMIESKQAVAITKQAATYYNGSSNFEHTRMEINRLYDNLNQGVTYADSYDCIIPADGLLLLTAATK